MTTLTTRAGKGSPLTNNEMDANLNNLNDYKVEKTSGTGSAQLPSGTTAQRDGTPQKGWTRYNSTLDILEYWNGTIWVAAISSNNPVFTGTLTTDSIINISDPTGVIQVGGIDVLRFGSDNSGALAGFRNILINGDMRINQRGVTIAAAANGAYGPDRWKKVDASNMTQIVESGNYKPSATYTLSGTGITAQQITSPASGNWTLPNIPIAATNVQLEEGSIATPFEHRPIGTELALCQRYYETLSMRIVGSFTATYSSFCWWGFKTRKRAVPTFSGTITGVVDAIDGLGVDGVSIGSNGLGGYAIINTGATASAEL